MSQNDHPLLRPALAAIFLALASVGISLSALAVDFLPVRIIMTIAALLLLAATGAFLAVVLARPRPAREN
ncbi:hypothetical protein ABIB35_001009 [Arthrobacter sp. UYP6]|uniref:hypothetical protein n=1 Tax=Arthrobacter sp. UYP6 TaxID=1756378 RepID=UPI003399404B